MKAYPVDIDSKELKSIIKALVKIYDWEMQSPNFFHNVTSRHLYLKIAERAIVEESLMTKSMKDIYYGSGGLTEKGIRIRLREFEENDQVRSIACKKDGRVKYVVPSESMLELIYLHATHIKKVLSEEFILIKK
jgi:hypothetical protein